MTTGFRKKIVWGAAVLALAATFIPGLPVQAADEPTTSVTIMRMAADGETVNREVTLTYQEMEEQFEVYGDGETKYYHQGIVTLDDDDPETQEMLRWDPNELLPGDSLKERGAVMGTNVRDLCGLVGDMAEGEEVKITGSDGVGYTFAYKNVYEYKDREGPMVLTWYKDGKYTDNGYNDGMKLVWLADDSHNSQKLHVFGNWDWHEAADEKYWYYYQQNPSSSKSPTTTGISVKYVSEIKFFTSDPPLWDINGDKKCNLGDITAIGLKWEEEGEEGWIAEDANRDGVVNILDVVKVGMYWGKSY
jgi:hypothetical protein